MSTEEARRYQEISDLLLELAERFPTEPSKRLLLSMARDYKEQAEYLATNDAGRFTPLVPTPLTEAQIERESEARARYVRIQQHWSALAAELSKTGPGDQ